jgi:hypothetical protein
MMMAVTIRKVEVLKLELSKIEDYYTREVLRQLIEYISKNSDGLQLERETANKLLLRASADSIEES